MKLSVLVLVQGVAKAFAPLGTGRPREVTSLQSHPVARRNDVIAEKLSEAAAQVSRLPEALLLAVESTPQSVYTGMYGTGLAALAFFWADRTFGWHVFAPELTHLPNLYRTFMWLGAFGTFSYGRLRRRVAVELDREPPAYYRIGSKSLAHELSAFTNSRSDEFFVFTPESGDTGLYSQIHWEDRVLMTFFQTEPSSFRDTLLERFGLETDDSLEEIGKMFEAVIGFRSMFLGGPFGGAFGALECAVVVMEIYPYDATEEAVKSVLEEVAAFKAGTGHAVELLVRVPAKSVVPEEVPWNAQLSRSALEAHAAKEKARAAEQTILDAQRANVDVTAAAAAATKKGFFGRRRAEGAISFFNALCRRARCLGLSEDKLYDLVAVRLLLFRKDRDAVDVTREVVFDYLASSKNDAAQVTALKTLATFGSDLQQQKR
mmetsp:Transcript_26217/g.80653  ORF Transcript_26217/g.80653 Transcript_26217/m.80653 type:complete len:432 (+) Transcript_26217:60-1355(+)